MGTAFAETLDEFAKKNEGLFAKEIADLPKTFIVRYRPAEYWAMGGDYNADSEQLVFITGYELSSQTILRECKDTGTYTARTSLGTQVVVTKRECGELEINETRNARAFGMREYENMSPVCRISMTPTQYREAKSKGIWFEIVFEAGKATSSEVVLVQNRKQPASIQNPVEITSRKRNVLGTIVTWRVYAADGKTKLAEYHR